MRRVAGVLLALVAAGGCASRGSTHYVRIAEGLTSPTLAEGIILAPRMFAASQLMEACQHPRLVTRLDTEPDELELRVGEPFALSSLRVVAVNGANLAVTDVPITIEAEETSPAVLQLRSDDPALDQGQLYPLNSGAFRVRIRTLCGGPAAAEATIRGLAVR